MILLAPPARNDEARQFISERAGVTANEARSSVLAFTREDEIVGVFMFEKWTGEGGSVTAHWAASQTNWLTRGMLAMVFMYAYDQLRANVIFGEVAASDKHTRRVNEKLGFTKVAKVPGYFPDDDLILYSLTKQDCRWLPAVFKEDAHVR